MEAIYNVFTGLDLGKVKEFFLMDMDPRNKLLDMYFHEGEMLITEKIVQGVVERGGRRCTSQVDSIQSHGIVSPWSDASALPSSSNHDN
jgi:hypothetical protein